MTEAEWLASKNVRAMRKALNNLGVRSWRKDRLFVVASMRAVGYAKHPELEDLAEEKGAWTPLGMGIVGPAMREATDLALALAGTENLEPALLRDVFGNPFRPVKLPEVRCGKTGKDGKLISVMPEWWDHPSVVGIACAIYDERAFGRMPVLADALEEEGCTDAAVLGHCRGPGPHVRGCHVLDLLLGQS